MSRSPLARVAGALRAVRAGRQAGRPAPRTARTVLLAHPSPDLYGSDRVMLETVSALVAAGRRVVVALPETGPLAPVVRERGGEVVLVEMPVLRKSALRPAGLVRLVAQAARALPVQVGLVRSTGADLVLVNTVTIPMWSLVARLAGRPSAVHVHEAESSSSAVVRRVLYGPLLLADRLVCNSHFTEQVVTGAVPVPRSRCLVVHNGVPGPDQVSPPRVDASGLRLLFVGRLSPRKGPQVAIDALAQLVADGSDARLQLLGSVFPGYEWFEAELREQVQRLGLMDRVDFLGYRADVWPELERSDIVLVPSTGDESFGNTAVEAMLAARPLVVSDSSGLREAAAGFQAARLVVPGDAVALAAAVRGLVDDWQQVREQVLSDRAEAQRRFGPQVYAAAMVAALDQVVALRR